MQDTCHNCLSRQRIPWICACRVKSSQYNATQCNAMQCNAMKCATHPIKGDTGCFDWIGFGLNGGCAVLVVQTAGLVWLGIYARHRCNPPLVSVPSCPRRHNACGSRIPELPANTTTKDGVWIGIEAKRIVVPGPWTGGREKCLVFRLQCPVGYGCLSFFSFYSVGAPVRSRENEQSKLPCTSTSRLRGLGGRHVLGKDGGRSQQRSQNETNANCQGAGVAKSFGVQIVKQLV